MSMVPKPVLRSIAQVFTVAGVMVTVVGVVTLILMAEDWLSNPRWKEFLASLKESGILGALESISIITALVIFVTQGRAEERKRARYEAWKVLDAAQGRETSYARVQALNDLNEEGVSLEGLDAAGADLRGVDLEGAELSRCNLQGSQLEQTNLKRARFWDANLRETNFAYADLREAEFYAAQLQAAEFRRSKLQQATFQSAELEGANFTNAELDQADFRQALLAGANFRGADLRGAVFRGADLKDCQFKDADLKESNFVGARHIPLQTVSLARNWKLAHFSPEVLARLAQVAKAERGRPALPEAGPPPAGLPEPEEPQRE